MVVEVRLNPVRFDRDDIPSIARVERRSQLFLTDRMRASIGAIVTETQHIQGSIVLGHRRKIRHVYCSLLAVESVEQSGVQHRVELAPQTLQLERVSRSELNLDPTVGCLRARDAPMLSPPRQSPEPTTPARRGRERSRPSRTPHRARFRRIRLWMPTAQLLAVDGQYPKAQDRHGTTHPRAIPSSVRDWSAAAP